MQCGDFDLTDLVLVNDTNDVVVILSLPLLASCIDRARASGGTGAAAFFLLGIFPWNHEKKITHGRSREKLATVLVRRASFLSSPCGRLQLDKLQVLL